MATTNDLVAGTEMEGKTVETVIRFAHGNKMFLMKVVISDLFCDRAQEAKSFQQRRTGEAKSVFYSNFINVHFIVVLVL